LQRKHCEGALGTIATPANTKAISNLLHESDALLVESTVLLDLTDKIIPEIKAAANELKQKFNIDLGMQASDKLRALHPEKYGQTVDQKQDAERKTDPEAPKQEVPTRKRTSRLQLGFLRGSRRGKASVNKYMEGWLLLRWKQNNLTSYGPT